VKHSGGSLETAIATARHRNLMVSFGILLLLAASVSLIIANARRAERLGRQQMEFVAGVSHELRTPLSVICSAGENLADGVIGDEAQVMRYGRLVRDEGRRLSRMVEQILELAGIQSGRRYDLREVQLAPLLEEAAKDCHSQLDEHRIQVASHFPPDLPAVRADAAALRQAIQNLLANAIKYSGDGSTVTLSAETVSAERGREVRIAVADQGPGIPAADLPHIFEPFYRGRQALDSQIHGNGLGLSLVKGVMESHGGSVTVESTPGGGSTFLLHLPAPEENAGRNNGGRS